MTLLPRRVQKLLPAEANREATTAIRARLRLGSPMAPDTPSPSPHAARPKAMAKARLSAVGLASVTDVSARRCQPEFSAIGLAAVTDVSASKC